VDRVHLYDFAMDKLPLQICNGTFTRIIEIQTNHERVAWKKNCLKWARRTIKFE